MSQYTTGFQLFTSVVDPDSVWSSKDNALLNNGLYASCFVPVYSPIVTQPKLRFTGPKVQLPGGLPVIGTVDLTHFYCKCRIKRGDALSGDLWFYFGIGDDTINTGVPIVLGSGADWTEYQIGGTLAQTGYSVTQLEDLIEGNTYMNIFITDHSEEGEPQVLLDYVAANFTYDYTGGGVPPPRLF